MGDETDGLDGELGIIAVEIMPVSFRITGEALQKDEMCHEIHCILKAHGWEKFVLVSHSWVFHFAFSTCVFTINTDTNNV